MRSSLKSGSEPYGYLLQGLFMTKLIVEVISSFLYLMCKDFKILVLPFLLFGFSHKMCALTLFKLLFQGD